jgi:hypothetical protein
MKKQSIVFTPEVGGYRRTDPKLKEFWSSIKAKSFDHLDAPPAPEGQGGVRKGYSTVSYGKVKQVRAGQQR